MIKHIVMWKLKKRALDNNKDKNAMMLKIELEALKHKINEIKNIEVGINISERSISYDACLYSEFNSKEDLDIYANHPDHLKIKKFIDQVTESAVVTDYEVYYD